MQLHDQLSQNRYLALKFRTSHHLFFAHGFYFYYIASHIEDLMISSIAAQVVACDTKQCQNIGDLVSEGVYAAFRERYPAEYNEFETCLKSEQPRLICKSLLADGLNKSAPFFFEACDKHRKQTSDNPMLGYNPLLYKSPFWFNSLGDIWRHASYKAPKTNADSCAVIEEEARMCPTDGTKKNEYCL